MANQEPLFTTEETLAIDPLILAYLAGFFDGEGTIGVLRHALKSGSVGFSLRCQITQTSIPILEKYRHIFGGRVYQVRFSSPNSNWAPAWHWYVSRGLAARFLRAMEPYLVLKAPQVSIALRFFEQYQPLVRRGSGHRSRVATQIAENARTELMALHQARGKDYTRKNKPIIPFPPVPLLDSLPNDVEMTYES